MASNNQLKSNRLANPLIWHYLLYSAIFVVVFLLYLPALSHDYVWDDLVILFQPFGYLHDNWVHLALSKPIVFSENYFRPLVQLSLFADFRFGKTSAWLSHAINLALFFSNGILMLLLANAICQKIQLSKIQSLTTSSISLSFYLLHTSNLESAAWVSGRFDLMMTTFLLTALLADINIKPVIQRMICVSTCFFLAALCKEMAAIFLPVLIIWHFMLKNCQSYIPVKEYLKSHYLSQNIKVYSGIFITGIFYLGLRYFTLGYLMVDEFQTGSPYGDLGNRLSTILKAFFLYLKVLTFPFLNTSIQYPQTYPVAIDDTSAIAGLCCLICLAIVTIKYRNQYGNLIVSPVILFIIAISPVLHIIPLKIGANIIHERFMAFPVALFSLSLIPLFSNIYHNITPNIKKILSLIFILWCLASALTLHSVIPLWNNSLVLWKWTYQKHRNDASALAYGQTLYHYGNFQEAFDIAESIKIKHGSVYLLQANSALALNHIDIAKTYYNQAIQAGLREKELALALADYAYIELSTNSNTDVSSLLDQSLKLAPNRSITHYFYSYYFYQKHDFILARKSLEKAIQLSVGKTKINQSYKEALKNLERAELSYKKTGILEPVEEILPY